MCSTARWQGWVAALYAKGATGNIATEDVVYLLQGLGIATGIDLDRLIAAGQRISDVLGRGNGSRVAQGAQRAVSHTGVTYVWVKCYRPHVPQQKIG